MGLDMYLTSVPKISSVDEVSKLETRLSDAFFEDALESEMNVVQMVKMILTPIPYTLNDYIKTKEEHEAHKAKYGYSDKVKIGIDEGYWRKFNALHVWFVKHVQKGIDECEAHIVTLDHLKKLEKTLANLTKENAHKVLPAKSGYFFGNTDYDEWYWNDVEETKKLVKRLINEVNHKERTLIYQSSW